MRSSLRTAASALLAASALAAPQTSFAAPSSAHATLTGAISSTAPARSLPAVPRGCTQKYVHWTAAKGKEYKPGTLCLRSTAKYSSWLVFEKNGNLVHYGGAPLKVMWSTHNKTYGQNVDRLSFQRDGNVVIYRGSKALWATDTYANRHRSDDFVFGIPDRDGIIDSAHIFLIMNPAFRHNRPWFEGERLWNSTPR